MSVTLPYIVSSRKSPKLLKRLVDIDAPILFEGIHTTYYLSHPSLKNRYKAIRIHNTEFDYYRQLSQKEQGLYKKIYLRSETSLLKKYDQKLQDAQAFFPLSSEDTEHYRNLYPQATHEFIPAFHPNNEFTIQTGKGTYGIYHGNLSHPENREAVLYLLEEVFPYVDMPMIVAGKEPSKEIIEACGKLRDCKLIANPSTISMEDLVQNAQIHILPTFQQSGVKLKLLQSLFAGRHVLVNNNMLLGTGLHDVCHIANSSEEFINKINELIHIPFLQKDIDNRQGKLTAYNNSNNAARLLQYFGMHQASVPELT